MPLESTLSKLKSLEETLSSIDSTNQEELLAHWTVFFTTIKEAFPTLIAAPSDDREAFSALLDAIFPIFIKCWEKVELAPRDLFLGWVNAVKVIGWVSALKANGLFTKQILVDLDTRLQTQILDARMLRKQITHEQVKQGLFICEARIKVCMRMHRELVEELAQISPALIPIHTRLVTVKQELEVLVFLG